MSLLWVILVLREVLRLEPSDGPEVAEVGLVPDHCDTRLRLSVQSSLTNQPSPSPGAENGELFLVQISESIVIFIFINHKLRYPKLRIYL